MANGQSVPLLRFPNEELSLILRCMDGRAILLFSLVSQKTKDIIKNSKWLEPRDLDLIPPLLCVRIGQPLTIEIISPLVILTFYKDPEDEMAMLEKPIKYWIRTLRGDFPRGDDLELTNPFNFTEWLEHLLYILNLPELPQLNFKTNSDRFDLGVVKSTFKKFKTLQIGGGVSADHTENVLRTFPNVNNLKFSNLFNEEDSRYQKLLIQNFDSLQLQFSNRPREFTLNDLLISNASFIDNGYRDFKWINQFLKLWIKGANPRLRELNIRQRTTLVPENVLKGVKIFRVIPVHEDIGHNNVIYYSGGRPDRFAVEIKRFDGIIGTVVISRHYNYLYFFSWNF